MTPTQEKLVPLYEAMAKITAPECATVCAIPHNCCDALYCEETRKWAKDIYGIALQPTGHSRLPFMGKSGCTVAPHLRPMCTLHTCAINNIGCKRGDPAWTERYFKLRDEIELLELEQFIDSEKMKNKHP